MIDSIGVEYGLSTGDEIDTLLSIDKKEKKIQWCKGFL